MGFYTCAICGASTDLEVVAAPGEGPIPRTCRQHRYRPKRIAKQRREERETGRNRPTYDDKLDDGFKLLEGR